MRGERLALFIEEVGDGRYPCHDSRFGHGVDALSGKEGDGLTVSFDDATVTQSFLSWKSFKQLLALKTKQQEKAPTVPLAQAVQPIGHAFPLGAK